MQGPVEWIQTVTNYKEEDGEVEVHSGYLRLNPEYCFDTAEPNLFIGFVQVIWKPKEEQKQ